MLDLAARTVVGFNDRAEYLCRDDAVARYGEPAVARAEAGLSAPPLTAVYGWELDFDDDPEDTWGTHCDACGKEF